MNRATGSHNKQQHIIMGIIADMFKAQLEELKRQDDELNREIQDTLKRCDALLDKLSKLDDE